MEKEVLYVLNPDYILRNDFKRCILVASSNTQCDVSNPEWLTIIHPAQAMILSFFSKPVTITNVVRRLSEFLELSDEEVKEIINPFIENEDNVCTEFDNYSFIFPKQLVIKYNSEIKITYEYCPEDFIYDELDFESARLINAPSAISIMVTNECATNCIYCYADRRNNKKCSIPFDRIKEIIKESRELKLKDIYIGGGEFFLYNNWYELLKELTNNGFEKQLISTKLPILESDIIKLKEFSNITFQVSLDTLNKNGIKRILGVSENYIDRMKLTLQLLDKHNIKFNIISILTDINKNEEDLVELYSYLSNLNNIKFWQIRIAYRSLYTSNEFDNFKLNEVDREKIFSLFDRLSNYNKIKIDIDRSYLDRGFFEAIDGSKSFKGAICSANRSHFYILPDGKVTICEQMYWNPKFIIGNILDQSIEEVWKSKEALKWVNFNVNDFREVSACKSCNLLDECYNKNPNKCWADVLKAYGEENMDFPDTRCIKAPEFINSII